MSEIAGERVRLQELKRSLEARVIGQAEAVDLALTALLAGGHILLEGPPGVGKTSLAQGIAENSGANFRRVQMTSDMLPSDIVGTLRLKPGGGDFEFRPGPVFSHVLLADELNRTSAKTQSALLEAMAEGRVTVDGTTHALPDPFFVVATQNPHESQGVYPLAESQLDRFMMLVQMGLPDPRAELDLYRRPSQGAAVSSPAAFLAPEDLRRLKQSVRGVFMEESLGDYLQKIAFRVRASQDLVFGASIRAMLQFIDAAKARAFLHERDFVVPEDFRVIAPAVLGHRLSLRGAPLDNQQRKELIREAVDAVEVPR
jgi:MoxR-like ATPase